jgi:hypothetical protein
MFNLRWLRVTYIHNINILSNYYMFYGNMCGRIGIVIYMRFNNSTSYTYVTCLSFSVDHWYIVSSV